MYIEGPLKSGKTSKLADKFVELIYSNVPTSEILFICANNFKRNLLINKIKAILSESSVQGIGALPVYSFNSLVYNSIQNNWPIIEESIPESIGKRAITPYLCGLDTTEYILKQCIKEQNQNKVVDLSFRDYVSDLNLLHQLLRRYTLITENYLSDSEVEAKSKLLNESFLEPSQESIRRLKKKTLSLRSLDYLRQTDIFLYLIEHNKINDFKNIKYLFADDVDELPYAAQFFLKKLMEDAKEIYFAADPDGGTRRGYLCACPDEWAKIKQVRADKTLKLESLNKIYSNVKGLFSNIKNNESNQLDKVELISTIKRAEMLDSLTAKIKELTDNHRILPQDIVIVTPQIDESIKYTLSEFFNLNKIKYQFIHGTKKLIDDPYVFGTLLISQLVNDEWNLKPSPFEIQLLFARLLHFPAVISSEITEKYSKKKLLDKKLSFDINEFSDKYKRLLKLIDELKAEKPDLYTQLTEIFSRIILPELDDESDLEDFNRMLGSLREFSDLFRENPNFEKDWVILTKNTVVSDNPPSAPEIKSESIIIATPQKIIDNEIESKIQIWLDVSGPAWTKDDRGPLYNSWVFQKSWKGDEYTLETHKQLTLNKTAHVIRKLMLCAREKVICFASQLDSAGNENNGALLEYLENKSKDFVINFPYTPREDQKPVLEYKGGKLAIPAVPGAGKTFIIQALIIELIRRGTKPGEILVLTYMESAARNILERIKKACPNMAELPYIRTIHGLALNIIKDEDNFTKLGLNSNFDMCDDVLRTKLIGDICGKYLPDGDIDFAKWVGSNIEAISKAKMMSITPAKVKSFLRGKDKELYEDLYRFEPIFDEYTSKLKELNLLDFDDLLINANRLLKEYPEIRKYYQDQFKYIIEDEAQDSSKIQQDLIAMISEGQGNLIRTGDTNQAITTTFSNADVQGFRDFIDQNKSIAMTCSQRCSEGIYTLANKFIEWSLAQESLKNTFYPIYMQPVEGKNPVVENCLNFRILDTQEEEKSWVLNEISKLRDANPDFTFGILLRTNPLVIKWAKYLEDLNIPFICFTDSLGQKKVFRMLLAYLEVLIKPFDNKLIVDLYRELISSKIYSRDFESIDFLNKMGSPFISYELTELPTENLVRFRMDIQYWLENSHLPPEELVLKLGSYYFTDIIDRSNVQLFSILISKYKNKFTNYEENNPVNLPDIVAYFKELSKKNRISGVRFFDDGDEDKSKAGYVQLMTAHKAKGLEFDAVFMPEMNEEAFSYCITPEYIKINDKALINQLVMVSDEKNKKSEDQIRTEQVEEHMRLIYVGITRAKKKLYMSSYKKISRWGKLKENQPSKVLEYFVSEFESASEGAEIGQ